MKSWMAVLLLTLVGAAPLAAQVMPPGYLNEMPDPARVVASFGGSDSLDRSLRQQGALYQLNRMVEDLAGGRFYRGQLTADEKRIIGRYLEASSRFEIPSIAGSVNIADAESRRKYWDLKYHYELDEALRNELLDRFFSPAWKSNYLAVVAADKKRAAAYADMKKKAAAGEQKAAPAVASRASAQPGTSPSGNLRAYMVAALLLLALGLARELRPFGLDASDPFMIRSGWRSYKVYSSTGTVLSPTKSQVSTTYVSGGGHNQPVSTSTSTSIYDQFFIRESNGFERAMQLTDVNIALREGHQVSAVWGIKTGKKTGSYFLFRNHSLQTLTFIDEAVKGMMRSHKWPVLPLMYISFWGTVSALLVLRPGDDQAGWTMGAAMLVPPVAFSIVWTFVKNLRIRRLKREISDKLIPIIDERASEQIATTSGAMVTPG